MERIIEYGRELNGTPAGDQEIQDMANYVIDTEGSFWDAQINEYSGDWTQLMAYKNKRIKIGRPISLDLTKKWIITKISIYIKKKEGATGKVLLRMGEHIISEVDFNDITTSYSWVDFTITGKGLYNTGETKNYIFLESRTGIFYIPILNSYGDNMDNYTGGSGTLEIGEEGIETVEAVSMEGFENFINGFAYKIYGDIWEIKLCTYNEYLRKVGVNASEEAKEIDLARDICKQAECTLNARTKVNWSAIYEDINDDLKEVLNRVVSNIAAMEGINYDMSGFSSRLEAVSMIDYLRWGTEKIINELKKVDIQKFLKGEA